VEIDMQHLAAQRVVLDLLHQSQALRPGVILHRQVHQDDLGGGMMDQVLQVDLFDLEVLGAGLSSVNHGRHTPGCPYLLRSDPARGRPGICRQWYRLHRSNSQRGTPVQARPPLNSNSEVTDKLP
jgi:hypothetical protein